MDFERDRFSKQHNRPSNLMLPVVVFLAETLSRPDPLRSALGMSVRESVNGQGRQEPHLRFLSQKPLGDV